MKSKMSATRLARQKALRQASQLAYAHFRALDIQRDIFPTDANKSAAVALYRIYLDIERLR